MIVNMVDAINMGIRQEMERDESVIILGEDVGIDGGVFRVTKGLLDKFGPKRVMDTPLAELGIVGISVGMALNGLKPVAEIQFDGFVQPALDQINNHASRIRNRTRGTYTVPMVLRFPFGGGIRALEHHSDSPETYFAHTPGLKVVIPSTPSEAKGLIASAIRDPDPVIFMEPKRIYRAIKEDIDEKVFTIPIGTANVIIEGNDITVISYGAMIKDCKEAIEESGISAELIDLRTLSPLDFETIEKSVSKTGRVVIVHEAPLTLGMGSEISAQISEKLLLKLKSPVKRITGYDVIMPLAKLEDKYIPSKERIIKGMKETIAF